MEGVLKSKEDLEVVMKVMSRDIELVKNDKEAYKGYQMALKRIARKDYASFEMIKYLKEKRELDKDQIDRIIRILEKPGLIDDGRFLQERIDFLRSQNRGNYRILEDLTKRGFDEKTVESSLFQEDKEDYLARGVLRAEHFLKGQKKGSKKQRQDKLMQHLVRQGYDFSDANTIADHAKDLYTLEDEFDSLGSLMRKSWARYQRRFNKSETKDKTINHALSKGYKYDMIQRMIRELENEN